MIHTYRIKHTLKERVKQLDCLYGVTELISRRSRSVEKILQGTADILPFSFQYPDVACSRLIYEKNGYASANFKPSKWCLSADILVGELKKGTISVYYLKKKNICDEGPFSLEERLLIDTVAEHIGMAIERIQLEKVLKERVKELTCLYRVSTLIETNSNSIDKILMGVVRILTESWQYSDITSAQVILDGKAYRTDNFSNSKWKQAAAITIASQQIGSVEVCYAKEMPAADEGPFLHEERLLLNAVAERLGRAIARIRAENQLEVERNALAHKNIALSEMIKKIQEEKKDMGKQVQSNVDKIIMPIIYAMENETPNEQLGYLSLLKKNLEEITSPFASRISKEFSNLSPTEIQICNLIKNGFSTKEIARLRGISPSTVNRHREHIRKKLKISNARVNLTTHLNFLGEIKNEG